ncbi:P-loop ATPase, Sll1717 family [Methylopila henanensis]|uniref:P-loop ATPase, Sll1717 family n=1 Tax=Methylopila henanensis TaxID=873516 RepID=A0ABW4K860_9HYPH
MNKLEVLQDISFGNQIAEEERDVLRSYFVETNTWRKILRNEIDIIYGPKGSGKSALYLLVQDNKEYLTKNKIILVPAENVRGDPAFKAIALDPPASEREFTNIWKLYFLTLIARAVNQNDFNSKIAKKFISIMQESNLLLSETSTLGSILKFVQSYIKKMGNPSAFEGSVSVGEATGTITGFSGRIIFEELGEEDAKSGKVSASELFNMAESVLQEADHKIWILLDRLDVAFDEASDLERNALRALFRAYRDLRSCNNLILKIFLRTDIWERISDSGFREATHLSRDLRIKWDKNSLKNLIIRRVLGNDSVIKFYDIDKDKILGSSDLQQDLFLKMFPDQVEVGEKQSSTFDWLIKRTADGTGQNAPREIIFFLNNLVEKQAQILERGESEPDGTWLFDRATFKQALPELSEYRIVKVLYSEYPDLKKYIEALKTEKTEHTVLSLSKLWNVDVTQARTIASRLKDIGFFEERGSRSAPSYWVPFIYRPYLNLVQGKADDN